MTAREAVRRFVECRNALKRELPPHLYHYTRPGGFFGILRDRAMWATNFRRLKDRTEVEYGRAIIRNHLSLAACANEQARTLVEEIASEFEHQPFWEVFVGCFSRAEDDVELWRTFADAAPSYCLEFDAVRLLAHARENRKRRISFHRVFYSPDEHDDEIANILTSAQRALEGEHPAAECRQAVVVAAAKSLQRLLPKFKSREKYEMEQEWRFIQWLADDDTDHLRFDTASGPPRPYVEVEFRDDIPITRVVVRAPDDEQSELVIAKMALRKAGLDVPVVPSRVSSLL